MLARGISGPAEIMRLALLMAALALGIAILRAFGRPMFLGLGRITERDLRYGLFSHIVRLPMSAVESVPAGEIMARSTYDLDNLRLAAGYGFQAGLSSSLTLLLAVGYMVYMSPFLTLLSFIPMALLPFLTTRQSRKFHQCHQNIQNSYSLLTEESRDNLNAVRLIKSFNIAQLKINHFRKTALLHMNNNMELVKVSSLYMPVMSLVISLCMAIVWGLGGAMAVLGQLTPGEIVAFSFYLVMLRTPMAYSGYLINLYQRSKSSAKRVNEIFERPPEKYTKDEPIVQEPINFDIEIRNLTFYYPGEDRPALDNISFKINNGVSGGIVGSVGSGKSTILKLLTRIYEPPDGKIFLGGRDITGIPLEELRSYFGTAAQDPYIFSDSIKENLLMAVPGAGEDELWNALENAGLAEEIEKLPLKLDTVLGEKGHRFSGGQKARLALARALLQERKVLLLDDPLSAVDTKAEAQILSRLSGLRGGHINLIISHRPLSISFCENIFVLDKGALQASGTHKELSKISDIYRHLVYTQELEGRVKEHV